MFKAIEQAVVSHNFQSNPEIVFVHRMSEDLHDSDSSLDFSVPTREIMEMGKSRELSLSW